MLRRFLPSASLAAAILALCTGLINPQFTPIHVTSRSSAIYAIQIDGPNDAKQVAVKFVKAVKGAAPAKDLGLDLSKTDSVQLGKFRAAMAALKQPALLFVRDVAIPAAKNEEAEAEEDERTAGKDSAGLLSVAGQWFKLSGGADGVWKVDSIDDGLQSCWAGGTDMLQRCVEYILADKDAVVPSVAGVNWAESKQLGKVDGKVSGATYVDLAGDGKLAVFVACASGDRLWRWDGKAMADITAQVKLASKSLAFTWGDFDGDGRLDLASWDGQALTIHAQCPDGFFVAGRAQKLDVAPIALAAINVGGKTGLLASASTSYLLVPKDGGTFVSQALPIDAAKTAALGIARPCLAADFDGDGVCDIIQPFEKGSIFLKGNAAGGFEPAVVSADLATGPGMAGACVGDWDADGLLDIFIATQERCCIWQNLGGGKFRESLGLSGELGYISKPHAVGAVTCDINNDGRQDVLITYSDIPPMPFFNRGFRSFGHAHSIDIAENELLAAAKTGQQAAIVADLNGDGAQDMVLVLGNGEVWAFFRAPAELTAGVRVALSTKAPGPVTITATAGKQALGAWNVTPGTSDAFFALSKPGKIDITCAGKTQQIALPDKPIRVVLP